MIKSKTIYFFDIKKTLQFEKKINVNYRNEKIFLQTIKNHNNQSIIYFNLAKVSRFAVAAILIILL